MKAWLQLLKLRITVASTFTTIVGYVLARGQFDWPLLPVTLGILLQACGSAALNQVQDARVDALMARTAGRPIPSGRVSRRGAAVFATLLLAVGTALLWSVSTSAALLGLGAAAIYNLVYTPLKRVTPFAALPGALIGALPPAMGWTAAGGYLQDPSIHLVAFFFFLWQIPHFWLLLLFYGQDYRDGGMPSLLDRFDRGQVLRLTFLWIAAVCAAALLLPLTSLFERPLLAYVLAGAGALVVARAVALLRLTAPGVAEAAAPFRRACRLRFMEINTFALLVCVLLVTDALMVAGR
ncbi:MAG: protoheme IX farnesyltransferase [bacterium]|nr:protoheme IX farnesyltransferase [bacterium]